MTVISAHDTGRMWDKTRCKALMVRHVVATHDQIHTGESLVHLTLTLTKLWYYVQVTQHLQQVLAGHRQGCKQKHIMMLNTMMYNSPSR